MGTNLPWPKQAEAKLARLWRKGLTGEVIAQKLGVSRSAVLGKAARLGLYRQKPRKPRRTSPPTHVPRMSSAVANAIVAAIEPDRRTYMQKFFGDPAPGRSALDQRNRVLIPGKVQATASDFPTINTTPQQGEEKTLVSGLTP